MLSINVDEDDYILGRGSYNFSVVFLLPMIFTSKDMIKNFNKGFINIYYHCEEDIDFNNDYKNRLYLVYNKEVDKDTIKLLELNKNYIKDFVLDEYLIYCFNIPDIYKQDFILYKQGKYKSTSKTYRDSVINTFGNVTVKAINNIKTLDNRSYTIKDLFEPSENMKYQMNIYYGDKVKVDEVCSKPTDYKNTFKRSNFYKTK